MSLAKNPTDNQHDSVAAKLQLRENVVRELRAQGAPVSVLETHCGLEGVMSAAWSTADSLTGIDVRYRFPDPRRRFIGDAMTVLRAIDLGAFNVFDLDPYGQPWPLLLALERRAWSRGELGAVVVTDGGSSGLRWGNQNVTPELRRYLPGLTLVSRSPGKGGGVAETGKGTRRTAVLADVHRRAIAAWASRCALTIVRRWETSSGGIGMFYSAIVVRRDQ